MSIPNSIAFSPDQSFACYSDTPTRVIQKHRLDLDGWPVGDPEPWIDLRESRENPDGATFDAEGCLWVALWGSNKLARFNADGQRIAEFALPVPQPSCPAFGGPELRQVFVTSAQEGMSADALTSAPASGSVFVETPGPAGLPAPKVLL